jgi:hypothetical protein
MLALLNEPRSGCDRRAFRRFRARGAEPPQAARGNITGDK